MGKLYWAIVIVVLVSGLTAAIYFGLQGKSVPLIRWSHFANSQEVSEAIQTRMSQELKPYQIYFIGPHPRKPLHVEVAVNLAQWLAQQSPSIIIVDTIMSEQNPAIGSLKPDLILDLGQEKERFLQGLKELGQDKKVIVIAPNIYVSHFSPQAPVSQMRDQLKNFVVMSFVNFPRSREEEKDFEFPCRTSESSASQLDWGCFILGQSRKFYVKKEVSGKVPGFLNLVRTGEYMLFLGR